MQRISASILAAVFFSFCLLGTCLAQEPSLSQKGASPNQEAASAAAAAPELDAAELSLGSASPSRESSNKIDLKKTSPGAARWAFQGPAGWVAQPDGKYSGMIGPGILRFIIKLKCFPAKEYPLEEAIFVPVELAFASAEGSFSLRNDLRPGRHKVRVAFLFDGKERPLDLYFRVLKEDGPVLLVDTHGLDFGTVESGRAVNRKIHIRNPGRGVLSWKVMRLGSSIDEARYISLFNPDVRDNKDYSVPSHLQEMVQLQGEWTGVEGKPLGKGGCSLQISFSGTGITLYGVKDSDPGTLNLKIDGDAADDIPCGSGYLESTEILILSGLEEGPHKLELSRKEGVLFLEGFRILGGGTLKGPAHWLKIVPGSGTTGSETDFVNVTVTTAGLAPGTYGDEIEIDSNSGSATVGISATVNLSALPQLLKIFKFNRDRDILYSCNPAAESPRKTAIYTGKAFAFSLFREDTPGTRPLYRWYGRSSASHYYTTSQEGDKFTRGLALEGTIGNIATTRLPGTRELYHWYSASSGIHTYTLDPRGENLSRAGFVYQGIVGYVK